VSAPSPAARPRARLARLAGAAAALSAALALAAAARAGPAPLPARLVVRDARLLATLDLSAAFAPELERELGNGLENVVSIWVAVLPEGRREPLLLYGRVVEILYDVWEESYSVEIKDSRNPHGAHVAVPDFEALRRLLAHESALDLGPLDALPRSGTFVVEARVELNPVSREQLQRTREYIANPAGGARASGGSRSVFGAVASFLLREPEPGTDVLLLRSGPWSRASGEVVPR
jgi:hypothetical protein